MCDLAYVLQVGQLERRGNALLTGMASRADVENLGEVSKVPDDLIAAFDASLVAEPVPETEAARILREIGVA